MDEKLYKLAMSVNIVDVYEKYSGNRCHYVKGNVEAISLCCFHTDHNPSLRFNTRFGSYHCFVCKEHGNTIALAAFLNGIEYRAAALKICKDFNLNYVDNNLVKSYENHGRYYDANLFASEYYNYLISNSYKNKLSYFLDRGLSLETIKEYKLGYMPASLIINGKLLKFKDYIIMKMKNKYPNISEDEIYSYGIYNSFGDSIMADRYVFTLFDSYKRPVGFAGRLDKNELSIDDQKYWNTIDSKYFSKSKFVYNYFAAQDYPSIYIVEGYMDALSMIELGYKNVIAIMGTALPKIFMSKLKYKELILCLDNDDAGKNAMLNIIVSNKDRRFKVLDWNGAKDFNELLVKDRSALENILAHPKLVTGIEYWFSNRKKTIGLSNLEGRSQFWKELSNLVGGEKEEYLSMYPINTLYTPVEYDFYWKSFNKLLKKEGK